MAALLLLVNWAVMLTSSCAVAVWSEYLSHTSAEGHQIRLEILSIPDPILLTDGQFFTLVFRILSLSLSVSCTFLSLSFSLSHSHFLF